MLIRQGLNFAVHMAAGVAFGALAVIACGAMMRRGRDDWREHERLDRDEAPGDVRPGDATPGNATPGDQATASRI